MDDGKSNGRKKVAGVRSQVSGKSKSKSGFVSVWEIGVPDT
jgi:hypothetical protein